MSSAWIVVGLGFGDEGKGSWVDHLVRTHGAQTVVRFNGGVQAHHHVVLPDGRFHGFRQFGAASFVPEVRTMLSRFMLVEPEMLLKEAAMLVELGVKDPLSRVVVSENAPVITPFARLLNQMMEVDRGVARHGSTGFGIGITQRDVEVLGADALYVRDLRSPALFDKLRRLALDKMQEAQAFRSPAAQALLERLEHTDIEHYVRLFRRLVDRVSVVSETEFRSLLRTGTTVFEGAQGVLLDQQYGFFPHVTRSTCTFANAEQLLTEAGFRGGMTRVGLLRGYGTRHGAGPFPTEDRSIAIPPCHNATNMWQGAFRTGWFDTVSARYALEVVGELDTLAVTNLDRMEALPTIRIATSYEGTDARYFANERTMRVLIDEVTTLADRADVLEQVQPRYELLSGWDGNRGRMEAYLDRLGELVGRRVDAYSVSNLHHKVYR
ncbi:MAG: adenylosuccinate synthetase [Bdellovibrionales bacterium]|nr:adenylosuccinate synthetase [Bdellovibrionales bacterium]